jgi:hypothetical protein
MYSSGSVLRRYVSLAAAATPRAGMSYHAWLDVVCWGGVVG